MEGKGYLNCILHGIPAPCVKWFKTTAVGKQRQPIQLLQIDHPTDFDKLPLPMCDGNTECWICLSY